MPFFSVFPMSSREINFSVIGQYVDYLVKEQGVKNIFGKSTLGMFLHVSSSVFRRYISPGYQPRGHRVMVSRIMMEPG